MMYVIIMAGLFFYYGTLVHYTGSCVRVFVRRRRRRRVVVVVFVVVVA